MAEICYIGKHVFAWHVKSKDFQEITTNLEFERSTEVFGDERLTGALLD